MVSPADFKYFPGLFHQILKVAVLGGVCLQVRRLQRADRDPGNLPAVATACRMSSTRQTALSPFCR